MHQEDAALSIRVVLDLSSNTPAYRQIADQLRTFIVEGLLNVGRSLPAARRVARELGVHYNTVVQSYRTLAEEGYLETTRGHLARVKPRVAVRQPEPLVVDALRRRLRELVAMARAQGLTPSAISAELDAISRQL